MKNKKQSNNIKKSDNEVLYMPIYMSIGISIGVAIGVAVGNMPVCMVLGLSIGLCIGVAIDAANKKKTPTESGENDEERK